MVTSTGDLRPVSGNVMPLKPKTGRWLILVLRYLAFSRRQDGRIKSFRNQNRGQE
ncbi:hypothetical protein [Chroococcidiopsis sp. SAG 2025]|uniref:hypothetical protein n=1 Tax=Chroococcidiopsis sp. SAG 2025 TaxID=171389 RepID=UPI0029370CAF|nr:hypothetical protein [Chroococcidiopsis sp. SAG 2025]